MAGKDHEDVLKKFRSKVLEKLYGPDESREGDSVDSLPVPDDEVHEDHGGPLLGSSSSTLSGLGGELRAHEIRLYGAQCCPTGSKHKGHVYEPLHFVGSSSYLSDDEESNYGTMENRRKRKLPHSPSIALQEAQRTAESSTSSNGKEFPGPSQVASLSAESNLTKNQKRKMKKKRREKERKEVNVPLTEFTFDSSLNNGMISDQSTNSKCLEDETEMQKWMCRYLHTIWESYIVEYSLESGSSDLEDFLRKLEECDPDYKDEGKHLISIVSAVVSQNSAEAKKQIEYFKEHTSLNSDLITQIIELLEFWIRKKMKN